MTLSALSDVIDEKYLSWFPYEDLNCIQKQSLPSILHTDENIIVSAPTGSGKSTLFEFAMIRSLEKSAGKTLFLCPTRALCAEKFTLWSRKFQKVQKRCVECTSDSKCEEEDVQGADLIIATPEKFDYMTRTAESCRLMEKLSLILIDEVHILGEDRGAALEAIISRARTILKHAKYRIVAVSATIPNIGQLALWLRNHETRAPAKILCFPDSMRPIPLKTVVLGYPTKGKATFMFDFSLNYQLPSLIRKYALDRPTLIFCSTRKSAIGTAQFLTEHASSKVQCNDSFDDENLTLLIRRGIGYHHGGLASNDRNLVESLFREGRLKMLCATSTLAIGVNLPAHLVIIKSTQQYSVERASYSEYSDLDIRQMIGRAGRAGYDTSGTALIMTAAETEHLYRSISEGKLEIDSQLLSKFTEVLNVDVINRVIRSFEDAYYWLSHTFLHVRMRLNPAKYLKCPEGAIDEQIKDSLRKFLAELEGEGSIVVDSASGIQPTRVGELMSRYFIKFESLKTLKRQSSVEPSSSIEKLLEFTSKSPELSQFSELRIGDKVLLNRLAKDVRLVFPLSSRKIQSQDQWKKPFLFLQIALQGDLNEYEAKLTPVQRADRDHLAQQSKRFLRFVVDWCLECNYAISLRNALELLAAISGSAWPNDSKLLEQCVGIGRISAQNLYNAGIRSLGELFDASDDRIQVLLRRNPPFAKKLKTSIANTFPIAKLKVELLEQDSLMHVAFELKNFKELVIKGHCIAHLVVVSYFDDSEQQATIMFHESISLSRSSKLERRINLKTPSNNRKLSCSIMFEDWCGLNQNTIFTLKSQKTHEWEDDFDADLLDEIPVDFGSEKFGTCENESGLISMSSTSTSNSHVLGSESSTAKATASEKPFAQMTISPSTIVAASCRHSCKDKLQCAHVCCKHGHFPTSSLPPTTKVIPQPPSIKRIKTLTDSRDFLRKYRPTLSSSTIRSSLLSTKECKAASSETSEKLYTEIEFVLR